METVTCPSCKVPVEPKKIGFTWWGGVLGPKMLHHVECPACRTRFNGKTGKLNNGAIAIYMLVLGVITFAVIFALMSQGS